MSIFNKIIQNFAKKNIGLINRPLIFFCKFENEEKMSIFIKNNQNFIIILLGYF